MFIKSEPKDGGLLPDEIGFKVTDIYIIPYGTQVPKSVTLFNTKMNTKTVRVTTEDVESHLQQLAKIAETRGMSLSKLMGRIIDLVSRKSGDEKFMDCLLFGNAPSEKNYTED